MKVLLTCGCEGSGHAEVFAALQAAGVAPALASRREALLPQRLHELMLRSHEIEPATCAELPQLQPGKVWHELAADLMLGNIEQPAWGWADTCSAVLLDFWRAFDAQTRFVLVYNAPDAYLARALAGQAQVDAAQVEQALARWQAWNGALLRFAHRNRALCVLVNSGGDGAQAQRVVDAVASTLGVSGLDAAAASPGADAATAPHLHAYLARRLLAADHPAWQLYQELEDTADLPAAPAAAAGVAGDVQQAWGELAAQTRRLQALATEHQAAQAGHRQAVEAAHQQLQRLNQALEQQAQAGVGYQARIAELDGQLAAARQAVAATQAELAALATNKAAAEARHKELGHENDLLLQQLHQVQEELEQIYLKNKALEAKVAQIAELEARVKQLGNEKTALASDKATLAQEKDVLAQEKDALLKDKSALAQAAGSFATERQAWTKEKAELAAARDTQAKLAAERAGQLKTAQEAAQKAQQAAQQAQQAAAKAQDDLKNAQAQGGPKAQELQQENDLLLMQLHQVQEELERYFLKYQELSGGKGGGAPADEGQRFAIDFWRTHQPLELVVDMRREVDADNWYHAEVDGRWAGPGLQSGIRLPALKPGQYLLELDIVDALDPEIVNGMQVLAGGQPVAVEHSFPHAGAFFPMTSKAVLTLDAAQARQPWQLQLKFPKVVSPADNGSDDERQLAVRLRTVKLSFLGEATA